MPIDVACPCGRTFPTKDEHAGKRAKCLSCGNVFTIPNSEVDLELAAAKAARDNARADSGQASSRRTGAAAAPTNEPKEGETDSPHKPNLRSPRRDRRWVYRKVKIKYKSKRNSDRPVDIYISPGVMAALGMILVGGVWIAVRLANDQIPVYGSVMVSLGLIRLIKGLLGEPEE